MVETRASRLSSVAGDAASTAISLAAVDWDICLIDTDVRTILSVLQDGGDRTYAGRSNSTPAGKAFLQSQVDGLMKEKAKYKEKRMLLVQRQQELAAAAGSAPEAGAGAEAEDTTPDAEKDASLPPQTPARRPSFPLGARLSSAGSGAQHTPSPAKSATEEEDRKAVAATTMLWKETVTSGTYDAPKKTAELYAHDGTLWGTVSEEVRDTPEQIYAYFDYFARLPELRVVEYTPVAVRVYGDFAVQAGTYTFAWQAEDGSTVEKRARFSFTFRRDNPGSPQPWTIVEHHSSSMPTAPAGLKAVGAAAAFKAGPKVVKEPTPDQKDVAATTVVWKDTVTSGAKDTPRKTADLYAKDATLWGTVSEEVRDTPEQIYAYFDYFARLPKLRLMEYTPVAVRVYGEFAVQAGTYTFAWQGEDGQTIEKRARFSFTFRRDPSSPQKWVIVEHHSSSMPTAPAGLKRASSGVNLSNLSPNSADGTATAPSTSPSTAYSAGSARDEDTVQNEGRGGSSGRAATGSAAGGVDYMRFPANEEGDGGQQQQQQQQQQQGAPATSSSESPSSSDSIFKMLPAGRGGKACKVVGGTVAAAALAVIVAVVVAPMFTTSENEAAPIATVAAVNVAAAIGAAIATGLAPVGGALSRM